MHLYIEPISYLEKGLLIFTNSLLVLDEDFKATSSLWLFEILVANVKIIMMKTGTSKSKNGDTFANFFIIVLF
ncbi:hypothetical protein CPT03_19860 [Pedobacter ginsengisoli]|uniref:Uncharacterized protein n=1 Tax=Pedobacter ginsengisoli TaxID=363852 RepID=A0A2D1UA95_9SPHI|nr:hypothetical protein CPT03_19860 [Pedobacter ginsengisoli]